MVTQNATTTGIVPINLLSKNMGLGRIDDEPNPAGSIEACNELLKRNHDSWHMYFRDVAGHNHIPHAILSTLAMGGGPSELKRAYDDGEPIQRPLPSFDAQVVEEMINDPTKAKFRERMNLLPEYTNFLVFFEREIMAKGWQAVFNEYCFSHTPLAEYMLAQLYEGLYHPLLHVGFGVEFELPSIVAEGLAHAASHDPSDIYTFFQHSEQLAQSGTVQVKPLIELYEQVRANDRIRLASRLSDGAHRVRDGVLGRAMEDIVIVAAQFQVQTPATQEKLERATAEMISCAAYTAGAAQKSGKARRIDFFIMHNVTCSLFLTVLIRQSWISIEDKVRLVEWKARLDLVWYASCSAPVLQAQNIHDYQPTLSSGMSWKSMYKAINQLHDDGHVAKFVRALKNGEEVCKPYEDSQGFPTKGSMWFKIAQICFDTTSTNNTKVEEKWVWGAGFDAMWNKFPDFIVAKDEN